MNPGLIVAIATVLGGLVAGVTTLLTLRVQIRKLTAESDDKKADAAAKLTASALSILEPAEKKAAQLGALLQAAEARIAELGLSLTVANKRMVEANSRADGLAEKLTDAERKVNALTDRLELAQRLLTEHGIPYPPLDDKT